MKFNVGLVIVALACLLFALRCIVCSNNYLPLIGILVGGVVGLLSSKVRTNAK